MALYFPPGSEVIISKLDHEANIAPWVALAAQQSLVIKWWAPAPSTNPKLLASDLKDLLSEGTVLVACTHASNILGTIHDIKEIAKAVHEVKGAMLCVDAVAYAPHRKIDVKDLGVDFYAFSWYKVFLPSSFLSFISMEYFIKWPKVYGPHISMLYAAPSTLSRVQSLGHFFNPSNTLEYKLGLAGSNYELTASIPSVLSYFSSPSIFQSIEAHEYKLQSILLDYLSSHGKVIIFGERDPDTKKRVSTISFVVKGRKSKDVVEEIDRATGGRMGVRWGSFYSNRLTEEVLSLDPTDGVIRASMVHYNTGMAHNFWQDASANSKKWMKFINLSKSSRKCCESPIFEESFRLLALPLAYCVHTQRIIMTRLHLYQYLP
jgi:selenocysteine lyase/cysteine desulfurase